MNSYCILCGEPLDNMHVDHIVPYSKGGLTEMKNSQALCAKCNMKKYNNFMTKILKLRDWQRDALDRLINNLKDGNRDFLCVAGVGAGKTIFGGLVFDYLKRNNIADSVVVISPSMDIKRNWALRFETVFGLKTDHGYSFRHAWPRDCYGISITFQSLNPVNIEILKKYINQRTLLIVDEVHHAGDEKSWGDAIQIIGNEVGFRLLLSGTPDRRDNSPIPFVKYRKSDESKTFKLESNFSYGYAQAVKDNVVCPVVFQRNRADIKTYTGKETLEYKFHDEKKSKRLFNQILEVKEYREGDLPSWVLQTFRKANKKLSELNDLRGNNFAGLIVCKSIRDAENLYDQLYQIYGADFVEIVTSKKKAGDEESSLKIEKFKHSKQSWIISINMISEGVDIERLRCIVYATNVTSMVRFVQVMGRGVRNPVHLSNNHDVCFFYLPDYQPLVENAKKIEQELAHVYKILENEEIANKRTEGNRSGIQLSLADLLLESESIDAGNVFEGDMWDVQDDIKATEWAEKEKVSKDIVLRLWKLFRSDSVSNLSVEDQSARYMTSTEEKAEHRQNISKLVNKISYILDGSHKPTPHTIKKIHSELNNKNGIEVTNTATLDQLKRKLAAAKKLFDKLN